MNCKHSFYVSFETHEEDNIPKIRCSICKQVKDLYEKKDNMKLIFLDFDGVLNSSHGVSKRGLFWDNPARKHIKALNKIVEETQASIVISSTWRQLGSYVLLWRLMSACGFKGRVIGKTKMLNQHRGEEIKQYIRDFQSGLFYWLAQSNTVSGIVILDDNSDMCELKDEYLVLTDPKKGLTMEDADKAISILNKPFNLK